MIELHRTRRTSLLAVLGVTIFGCTNHLFDGRQLGTPPDTGHSGPTDSGVLIGPDGGIIVVDPDGGVVFNPFQHASIGTRCIDGTEHLWIVLSGVTADCATHAQTFASPPANAPVAFAELPAITAPTSINVMAMACWSMTECDRYPMLLQIDSYGDGTGATGQWSIQLADSIAAGSFDASWCDYDTYSPTGGVPLAKELRINQVSIYQSVKIELVENGQRVSNLNAPVVENRPGLIRIFVQPGSAWQQREVIAKLTLQSPAGGPFELTDRKVISRASTDSDGNSTFNIEVPAERITQNLTYSVELLEIASCLDVPGAVNGARFPAQGTAPMDVDTTVGDFNVVLVPFRYNYDGSGRLPDTSAGQVNRYRNLMFTMYPIPGLNITVRNAVDWNQEVARNGTGWTELLNALLNVRQQDQPAGNVYYYGIFSPASSIGAYCSGGCVAGLGPVPGARDSYSRGAIGLGFSGDTAAETFVHEIGHALGRLHAPCGTPSSDPNYPYSNGNIGSWGLDLPQRRLISPTSTKDMMGYCDPTWISDYNYDAIFVRIATVNASPAFASLAPSRWRVALDDPGGLRWGDPVDLFQPPHGESQEIVWSFEDGRAPMAARAHRYPLSHLDGALILIPDAPLGVRRVDIEGVGTLSY